MSEFGIYFGTQVINITEVERQKPLINISIPQLGIISSASEQKTLNETKIVVAVKEEFRKNKILPSNINVCLAGEDLIIRTFDLPIFLSKQELGYNAIAFEAKKYIPFKIDDLVFNFQSYPDRKDKKYWILFVGMRKKTLDSYLSIFDRLEIQPRLIEYAGFSILRLLRLGGIKVTGILGLLNIDLEDEINFLVCQNGFPLFSRDITLSSGLETEAKSSLMDKLKSEIRISLDFFRRKFPAKPLDKVIILSSPRFQTEIAVLIKDLGLSAISLDTSMFLGKDLEFSGGLVKSYAAAINSIQRLRFPIDLLRPVIKKEAVKELSTQALPIEISTIKINPKLVLLAFLIIFLIMGVGWRRRLSLENELKAIRARQPKIEGVSGEQGLTALVELEKEYSHKIDILEDLVKKRFYLTEVIDFIPRVIPEGVWLSSLSFSIAQDKLELKLEGIISLADSEQEFAAVNEIVAGLKKDPKFSQRFKKINVLSMERTGLRGLKEAATRFAISCN